MKKLLLAALLLLTAVSAEARQVTTDLLVVKLKSQKAAGASQGISDVEQGAWIHENIKAALTEWGVDHIVYDASALPTGKMEWLRTGRVVVGPDTITARAVLHERASRRAATLDYPAYRPDSMFMTRIVNGTPTLPSVPSYFVLEPGPINGYLDAAQVGWQRTTACSIGVTNNNTAITAGSGVPHECEGCYYSTHAAQVFMPQSSVLAGELDRATVGGVAPLLSIYMNAVPKQMQEKGIMVGDMFFTRFGADGDTTGLYESTPEPRRWDDPDTAIVWKRLNIGWNVHDHSGDTVAAAQMVMATASVAVGIDGSSPSRVGDAFEYTAFFVGLAALDSLLGGELIGKTKTQAVTIDGAFARCEQQYSMGVYLPDSAAIKATVDSLVAHGIPFLVGVNVDSVAAYPYEKAWWSKGGARFSPQVWSGVQGANGAASYVAGKYTLRDIFGHARARQAYGPANGLDADTTVYAQLKYAFARTDSLFPGRSSRFLLPPLDDYVPTNTVMGDSVLIAAYLAGASGLRIAAADTLRQAFQTTNVQGDYFGLALRGHTGEYVTGGSRIMSVPGGTAYPGSGWFVEDSGYVYHPFCNINDRQLSALVRGRWTSYSVDVGGAGFNIQFQAYGSSVRQNVPLTIAAGGPDPNLYHNGWSLASRASILKVAASTLGGSTYVPDLKQPQGAALRPGWWVIRSADGFAKVVNAVAGRTLIRWGYPEEIER